MDFDHAKTLVQSATHASRGERVTVGDLKQAMKVIASRKGTQTPPSISGDHEQLFPQKDEDVAKVREFYSVLVQTNQRNQSDKQALQSATASLLKKAPTSEPSGF